MTLSPAKTGYLGALALWGSSFLPPAQRGEKAMATYSGTLAWKKISWMEETGRLQSMGS